MSSTQYYVVGDHDVWIVQGAPVEWKKSSGRSKAMDFAICAAQRLGMRGARAHVCVLDDDGCFRTRWTQHTHAA